MQLERRFKRLSASFLVCFTLSFGLSGCDFIDQLVAFFNTKSVDINLKPGYKPYPNLPNSKRALSVRNSQLPNLPDAGDQVFIRIFKQERQLEVWLRNVDANNQFKLFKSYDICNFSGGLGPKLKEGDFQSPEGFYVVKPESMNPNSSYHLSFNLGYPNRLERNLGRTGSFLMVHGGCLSIGCYAMTDPNIEQVYTLVYEAFGRGQKSIQVHAYPFRPTDENLARYAESDWQDFWKNLQEGYESFEATKRPPKISVSNGRYAIEQQEQQD